VSVALVRDSPCTGGSASCFCFGAFFEFGVESLKIPNEIYAVSQRRFTRFYGGLKVANSYFRDRLVGNVDFF
jgi:hypothetical protein